MTRKVKIVLVTFVIISLFVFFLYLYSFRPRKINLTYDGIMYSKEAYLAKDYNNLDIKKIKLRIEGNITKKWFKTPYFEGKFDIDLVLPDIKYIVATTLFYDYQPSYITYYQQERDITSKYYARAYYDGFFEQIYLELLEFTDYDGYSLVAPAQNIEDIDSMWEFLKKNYSLFFN